ncbi:MAG TPA: hypothetical protein DF984_07435 [Anaerolineaceae bacterium]|nr:hypothetical protein [Anaerolineaceae bacterium]
MSRLFRHKSVLIVIALLIIITGGMFYFTANPAIAEKDYQPPSMQLDDDEVAEIFSEEETETPVAPASTLEPPSIAVELSTTAQTFLHAGWLHFIRENSSDTDRGSNGMLENGAVLSANHFWECWLNLDESLQIQESICIQTNLDGSIIQVGVRSGSISWNSAMDEISTHDEQLPSYITDIDALLRRVATIGVELETETVTDQDGNSLIQFSYQGAEESSIPLEAYNLPVIRWDYIHQFDPETGMMVSYQEWVTFEDGSRRIIQQTIMQVFEILDSPSEEVEYYLSELEKRQ